MKEKQIIKKFIKNVSSKNLSEAKKDLSDILLLKRKNRLNKISKEYK
jgi:hypothetical protein